MLVNLLIELFIKREVAIVSEMAGTTRDVIEVHLNLNGFPTIISDTAGIRESIDEIENKGIKLALREAENADLILIVLDPKNVDISSFLKNFGLNKSILVINKIDLGVNHIAHEIKKI